MDDLSEINQGRNPNLVELTDWTAVGTGIWNLSNGDLTVRQTGNVNDLYYLAPYDVQNKSITFSMGALEIQIMITSDLSLMLRRPPIFIVCMDQI